MTDKTQYITETHMKKEELGKKLCCINCKGKFFDFKKYVENCPLCNLAWNLVLSNRDDNENITNNGTDQLKDENTSNLEEENILQEDYLNNVYEDITMGHYDNFHQDEFTCFYDEDDTFA